MPRKKKSTTRKKAARRGVAAGVTPSSTALDTIVISSQSSPSQPQKWASVSSLMESALPGKIGYCRRSRPLTTDTHLIIVSVGTSMQQLALNTRNKASHWDQNSSLRARPVTFVSGGFVKPSEKADGSDVAQSSKTAAALPSRSSNKSTSLQDGTAPEAKTDCSSSDEEILFKGRVALKEPRHIAKANIESLAQQAIAVASASPPPAIVLFDPPGISGLDLLISKSGEESDSDAAINDYIDNMSAEDMAYLSQLFPANRRELGEPQNDVVIGISSSGAESGYERCDDTGDSSTDESDQADKPDSASATRMLSLNRSDCRLHHIKNARQRTKENSDFNDSPVERQLTADTNGNLSSLPDKDNAFVIDGDNPRLSETNSSQCVTVRHGQSDKQCKRSKRLPAWQTAFNFTKDYRAARGSYPSAEAVADAFEQLDVTGWGRSLDEFHLHLSDSELETTLRKSWQKDRMRKKEKRKARDELRSQGLLKKNADPNDSRIKYPNGMSLDDLKAEFYLFLSGSNKRSVPFFGHKLSSLSQCYDN